MITSLLVLSALAAPIPEVSSEPLVFRVEAPAPMAPVSDPVLGQRFDRDRLLRLEPEFLRLNRRAGLGVGVAFAGMAAGFGGMVAFITGAFGGSEPLVVIGVGGMVLGSGMIVGGPIVSISGTMRAARLLSSTGLDVPMGWTTGAVISGVATPAWGITYPLFLFLPLGQAVMNRQVFMSAMGRPPGMAFVGVAPVVNGTQRGLALVGRW